MLTDKENERSRGKSSYGLCTCFCVCNEKEMMNMPAYKDNKTGTWFVKFYCKDWTGENKQIKKRGFATKREALDYERNYKIRQENNLDMTFGKFWKLYTEDVKPRVKLNTWLTKWRYRLKSRYSTKGVGIATVERISKRKNGMSIKGMDWKRSIRQRLLNLIQ